MSYGPSLLQATWDEMDALTEALLTHNFDGLTTIILASGYTVDGKSECAARARGIASVLARFMVPHLTTEDEVVRESVKRYKMKQDGEEYETPGLGTRHFEPPPGDAKLATRPARPGVKIPSNLTPTDVDDIKASVFPVELLAATYDVTPAVINMIRS